MRGVLANGRMGMQTVVYKESVDGCSIHMYYYDYMIRRYVIKMSGNYEKVVELIKKCEEANETVTTFLEEKGEFMTDGEKLKAIALVEQGPVWRRSAMVKALLTEQREAVIKMKPKKTPRGDVPSGIHGFHGAPKRLRFEEPCIKMARAMDRQGWPYPDNWFGMTQARRINGVKIRYGRGEDYPTEEAQIETAKKMEQKINEYEWTGETGDMYRKDCLSCVHVLVKLNVKDAMKLSEYEEWCVNNEDFYEAARACLTANNML